MGVRMKIIKLLIILIVITVSTYSQVVGKWRHTNNFKVTHGDYVIVEAGLHYISNTYLVDQLEDAGVLWWKADLITFSLGCLWEVKDAYLPREKYTVMGGYGFCHWDIVVNVASLGINRLIDYAWNNSHFSWFGLKNP